MNAFQSHIYKCFNPDVKHLNRNQLLLHWKTIGCKEKRIAHIKDFTALYPDYNGDQSNIQQLVKYHLKKTNKIIDNPTFIEPYLQSYYVFPYTIQNTDLPLLDDEYVIIHQVDNKLPKILDKNFDFIKTDQCIIIKKRKLPFLQTYLYHSIPNTYHLSENIQTNQKFYNIDKYLHLLDESFVKETKVKQLFEQLLKYDLKKKIIYIDEVNEDDLLYHLVHIDFFDSLLIVPKNYTSSFLKDYHLIETDELMIHDDDYIQYYICFFCDYYIGNTNKKTIHLNKTFPHVTFFVDSFDDNYNEQVYFKQEYSINLNNVFVMMNLKTYYIQENTFIYVPDVYVENKYYLNYDMIQKLFPQSITIKDSFPDLSLHQNIVKKKNDYYSIYGEKVSKVSLFSNLIHFYQEKIPYEDVQENSITPFRRLFFIFYLYNNQQIQFIRSKLKIYYPNCTYIIFSPYKFDDCIQIEAKEDLFCILNVLTHEDDFIIYCKHTWLPIYHIDQLFIQFISQHKYKLEIFHAILYNKKAFSNNQYTIQHVQKCSTSILKRCIQFELNEIKKKTRTNFPIEQKKYHKIIYFYDKVIIDDKSYQIDAQQLLQICDYFSPQQFIQIVMTQYEDPIYKKREHILMDQGIQYFYIKVKTLLDIGRFSFDLLLSYCSLMLCQNRKIKIINRNKEIIGNHPYLPIDIHTFDYYKKQINRQSYKINTIVIHLEDRLDKKKYIEQHFQELTIENYQFFKAIKPIKENLFDYSFIRVESFLNFYNIDYVLGAAGCKISHYQCIQSLNKDLHLLVEDDVILEENYLVYVQNALHQIEQNKIDYDILYLSVNLEKKEDAHKIAPNVLSVLHGKTTTAYLINPDKKQKILQCIENSENEIDEVYSKSDLKKLCIYPMIAHQKNIKSDIVSENNYLKYHEKFSYE